MNYKIDEHTKCIHAFIHIDYTMNRKIRKKTLMKKTKNNHMPYKK